MQLTVAIKILRMLFMRPDSSVKGANLLEVTDILHRDYIDLLYKALLCAEYSATAEINNDLSCSDYFNLIADRYYDKNFEFDKLILEAGFQLIVNNDNIDKLDSEAGEFVASKLEVLFLQLKELASYLLENEENSLNFAAQIILNSIKNYEVIDILERLKKCDPFFNNRTFLYHHGNFQMIKLERYEEDFFGYDGVKNIYNDHFSKFSKSEVNCNVPLLISSLPGHGKTQMTITNSLKHDNLTLIFAEPDTLEKELPNLISQLSMRKDRKFVLFFDDIVPDEINWYYFKNYVGGSFILPENILIVLASNYHFGASLLSRGRSVLFPIFDEIRCMEMVEGFLISCHLPKPKQNLIMLIAADYTEHFGQKRFSELSPRTLMRYLSEYKTNLIKRKTMLHLSFGSLITKPDAQLFYDFNVDLMRKLYGNEYIEQLLKERLKELER